VHFVFPRGFSVGYSVYKEMKFPKCGHWIPQLFLSADRSIREDARLTKERDVPDSVFIRTEVLRVLAIAVLMGAEMGYAPVRSCLFPNFVRVRPPSGTQGPVPCVLVCKW